MMILRRLVNKSGWLKCNPIRHVDRFTRTATNNHCRTFMSLTDSELSYEHGVPVNTNVFGSITLGQMLERVAQTSPDNMGFVVAHQNIAKTYLQFNSDVDQLAKALLSIGCRRGDKVGIWAVNSYEWLLTQFATAKLGCIFVTVNPGYKESELLNCINLIGLQTLISNQRFKSSNYYQRLQNISPGLVDNARGCRVQSKEMPTLKNLILLDDEEQIAPNNAMRFSELMAKGQSSQSLAELIDKQERTQFDDVINVQFTSGTTGLPKGAMLTHHNIIQNVQFIVPRLYEGLLPEDNSRPVICIPNPLYHCFGCVVGSSASIYANGTMVLPSPVFNARDTLAAIEKYRCNVLYGTPTMWSDIMHVGVHNFDTSTLKRGVMSGASCPPQLLKSVLKTIPSLKHILIPYGSTETSPVATLTTIQDDEQKQLESVGRPLPYVEIKVIDPQTGRLLPRGEKGEICIRGHGTFAGYYSQPEKTREVVDQNYWYHTGDIGHLDNDGYLRISGRIKEMIIRGGENIYPREIEEYILEINSVEDAHVVGIPDKRLGEEMVAYVKLKNEFNLAVDELKSHLKEKISHFKVPKHILFVEDFPRTVTGKVRKVELKEMARLHFQCKNTDE